MPMLRTFLLIALLAEPALAQRWADRLSEGAHIRVQTQADGQFEGAFRRPVDDSLRILGSRGLNNARPISLAMANVTSVDRSTGSSRLKRGLAGLAIGTVTGGVIGALIGNSKECARYGTNQPGECFSYSSEVGLATAIMGVAGAAVGGVLGGAIGVATARDGWENVYHP